MATVKGIDISTYQKTADFAKIKAAGYSFVIIRAGYGRSTSQKDAMFESHYKGAKAAGLGVGCYWYGYATNTTAAKLEATCFKEVIKGKQFDYPVYYDVEEGATLKLGKTAVSNIIKAFCDDMEAAGYYTGLYMSKSHLVDYTTDAIQKRYTLWVAQYYTKCTYSGAGKVDMWQKASDGKVNGLSGNIDLDECYVDFPTIIKSGGYNGYTKSTTEKTTTYTVTVSGIKTKSEAEKLVSTIKTAGYTGKITEVSK